ncbi:MAG: DUF1646 family protein [Spirochaetaceae bacterium]|nr:DUF1646 family protein [Spirochaetaceae bacterium]
MMTRYKRLISVKPLGSLAIKFTAALSESGEPISTLRIKRVSRRRSSMSALLGVSKIIGVPVGILAAFSVGRSEPSGTAPFLVEGCDLHPKMRVKKSNDDSSIFTPISPRPQYNKTQHKKQQKVSINQGNQFLQRLFSAPLF